MRRWVFIALAALLSACGNRGGPDSVEEGLYQDSLGETVFRQMLADLPDIKDGAPKVYTLALFGNLLPCDDYFVDRFKDTAKTFASASRLIVRDDGHPMDPESRLSPIILQLKLIRRDGPNNYLAETGWSYKGQYEMATYRVTWSADRKPKAALEKVVAKGVWKAGDPRPGEKKED